MPVNHSPEPLENFQASIAASLHSDITLDVRVGNILSKEDHILIGTGVYFPATRHKIIHSPETGKFLATTDMQYPSNHHNSHKMLADDAESMVYCLLREHLSEDEIAVIPKSKIDMVLRMFQIFQLIAQEKIREMQANEIT